MNTKKMIMVIMLVLVVFMMVGCDGGGGGINTDAVGQRIQEDYNSAWQDSGATQVFGAIDNALVGGITGIDYTK